MVVIGVLYLVFEDFILADFAWPSASLSKKENHITRTLVGVQVGLAVLSMIITRSSALSLQAKKGLPPGNRALGWIVLGKILFPISFFHLESSRIRQAESTNCLAVASFLMPLAYRLQPNNHHAHRLLMVFLTCVPTLRDSHYIL